MLDFPPGIHLAESCKRKQSPLFEAAWFASLKNHPVGIAVAYRNFV
jgi:hypothetical protein